MNECIKHSPRSEVVIPLSMTLQSKKPSGFTYFLLAVFRVAQEEGSLLTCIYTVYLFFINFFIFIFIYFWLRWVFVAARGLSLVLGSRATLLCSARASHCGGFSLRSTGSRRTGFSSCGTQASVVAARRL